MADVKTEKQKVKEITDKLEEGLKELFESEKYKRYLSTMSKFHNYSANNIQLIAMQRPDATLVAGYQAWQKNFGRHVNKGERAIRILAPAPYKIKEERDKLDPDTGEMIFDENGMPQKEEVEIKIPAFRVVSVFDIGQTDGKPLPELEVKELLNTVEGYEDFKQSVMNVAPVPIRFEDIPGDSKGYFNPEEKRIAVQENMAESQTLKTMIHETAHSMLHDKEVNRSSGLNIPVKDRNTKEVEAESIAFTVCQHFGIDTSDYSFGYIAGWSTGRDMKELKSSLDTIRKTASELITGIEGQLQELQRDREMMQEQSQEFILAVSNTERTHFDIASVRGMEGVELLGSLLAMKDADRENVEAYLESMGAWVTHLGDDRSEDVEEFHVDYIYNTDTYEITDVKYAMEMDRKAKEPIKNSDVVLKIVYRETDGFEIDKITNMTQEQALDLAYKLAGLDENEWDGNIQDFMEENGAEYVPIIVKGGRNDGMPEFFDIAVDLKTEEVSLEKELSGIEYAASVINRLEYGEDVFSDDERNLIVNYAHKLNDKEKTRELAEHIYYEEAEGNQGAALAVIDAQAEIDALPDPEIGLSEMEEYGYTWKEMLPLTKGTALELFDHDLPVYLLHEDGSETSAGDRKQITEHEGIFGIEKSDWENEKDLRTMQEELDESRANREAQLLYGSTDKYGIYQLKDNPELRDFHFAGTKELLKRGILSDDFKEIQPENYNLIYVGELSEFSKDFIGLEAREETLGDLYVKFNTDHPEDFKGHSLSVSDIVVLHENGENSAHFVDSIGFAEVPAFMRELEGGKEQEEEIAGNATFGQEQESIEDGDEIIDLGDEKDQVLAEMKQSLAGSKDASGQDVQKPETELAFQIADRFISIHETDEGYDYSIMGEDYKVIDGGIYDNPDVSIREALGDIVDDLKSSPDHNGAKGNIHMEDELTPIDYNELLEKTEETDRIVPETVQSSVVEDFRAKTEELFHEINGQDVSEIEETVKCYIQAQLDECGIDAVMIDAVVTGSRCRGIEKAGSDLDVVVELFTNEREDHLFNILNENALLIGGVKVDINPITAQQTGTLESYLPQAEEYLAGIHESEEQEKEVTLTVAECGEFHNLGEFHENIPTVEEAVAIWKQIPPERMHGVPAIGINIHTPGTETIDDVGIDVMSGKHFDLDILEYIPEIKGSPQAVEVIAELMAKLPEMEIHGDMSKEMEVKVWEKRIPDLEPEMQLAVQLDIFSYHNDPFEHDAGFDSMNDSIPLVYDMLKDRQTEGLEEWLNGVIFEGATPEDEEQAKELLEKLTEYKPLAKIEEMEEANYNMVDNVLNNGAGDKAQKEENKKEQESTAAKPSLKDRLAEKKELVSGQGKDHESQENNKNKQREM